jgi:hypothetical protein
MVSTFFLKRFPAVGSKAYLLSLVKSCMVSKFFLKCLPLLVLKYTY